MRTHGRGAGTIWRRIGRWRYEGHTRKREGEGADFKKDLGPMRWHVTRCDEDMSVKGRWDSDRGHTEETAAAEQYEGKLWDAVTPPPRGI